MEYKWNMEQCGMTMSTKVCLNPCFNGIQMELSTATQERIERGLNPCFNGLQMELIIAMNEENESVS